MRRNYDKKYVYKLTFPNGMVYFGSTWSVEDRWRGDGDGYKDMAVNKPIQEFGWENVKKEVILRLESHPNVILAIEQALIEENKDICYNIQLNPRMRFKYGKQDKAAIVHVWMIDGIAKSAEDWAKEYGTTTSKAMNRMKSHPNMTPLEALTFPNVPRGLTKLSKEFWEANGCIIGFDKTSYVLQYPDWPDELKARAAVSLLNVYEKLEE